MGDDGTGAVGGLFWLGISVWLLWPAGNSDWWNDRLGWSFKYDVSYEQVHVDAIPADCKFSTAPLGSKQCHFKSHVRAYNAAGIFVGGDDAPKYSRDSASGKPIISYDDGTTWR